MKSIVIVLSLVVSVFGYSQKVEIVSGSTDAIKNIKVFKLEMDFEGMMIKDKGSEEDLKEKVIAELDAESDDAGNDWREDWEKNKKKKYPSKFTRAYNKFMVKHGQMIATRSYEGDFDGKIVVKTESIGLGFKKGRKMEVATVTALINFYDNSGSLQLSVRVTDSPGAQKSDSRVADASPWFATFERIGESYAVCGKKVGILVYEDLFK